MPLEQVKRSVEDLKENLKEMLRDLPDPQRVQVFIPFLRVLNEEKGEYWEQQAHNLVYWGGGNRDPDRLYADFQMLIESEGGVSFGDYMTNALEVIVAIPMYTIGGAVAGTFMAANAVKSTTVAAYQGIKQAGGKVVDAFWGIVALAGVFAAIKLLLLLLGTRKD